MDTTTETTQRVEEQFTSLYVHFPFCETKCHYCDFFSLPEKQVRTQERARIYRAIEREALLFGQNLQAPLQTVFLGGGTPSLVPLDIMAEFVGGLRTTTKTELTMEANPSSISRERAVAWRALGINRISMGLQALDDERLRWLGRVHSKAQAFEALEALFVAGFSSVSTDYIVGVPAQSCETIERELAELLERFPHIRHVSAYLLTLKGANPKFKELPAEETQLAHLRAVSGVLAAFGFEQYEVSNFARPGSRALHNENYWLGGGYLGIGPSAHSYWPSRCARAKNWASLGKYCELVERGENAVEWTETLSPEQARLEYLMLRLRRADGLDLVEYERLYGHDLYAKRRAWIDAWEEKGLCRRSEGKLRLTKDGFFLSDKIINNIC